MFQKIVLSSVLFVACSVVAFFLLIKVIDFNEYKPKLQKAIKENTGYDVSIKGDISLSLSPVGVSITDVDITNPQYRSEAPFAQLGSFDVALDISALIQKEIKVKHIRVDGLQLNLEKSKDGRYNYELLSSNKAQEKKNKDINQTQPPQETLLSLINVKVVKFSNVAMKYTDAITTTNIAADKINMDISDINYDTLKHGIQGLSFVAQASIDKIQYGSLSINAITMPLTMKEGVMVSEQLSYTVFDTPVHGSCKFDFSGKQPKISLKGKVIGLKLPVLSKSLWNQDLLEGNANGDFKLSFFLGNALQIKSTLNGFVNLFGEEITVKGYNIEKMLSLFSTPQKGMKDFSLGTWMTASREGFKGGNTFFKEVSAKVAISYSEAHVEDVAFATQNNRVALKGAVNIVDEKLIDFRVAILDALGCASFEQNIQGTISQPILKLDDVALSITKNLVSSLGIKPKSSAKKVRSDDENCTLFYEGSVKHPVIDTSDVAPQQ